MVNPSSNGSSGAARRPLESGPEVLPEAANSPTGYAAEVREAYEAPDEKVQPPSSRKVSFLSRAFSVLWEKFRVGTPLEKGLMIGGGALAIYSGIKVIEKTIAAVRKCADSLFSLGDDVDRGVEAVRSTSREKLLSTLLGGAAVGGLLYLLVSKVDWSDLFAEARDHPGGFVKGFLAAVAARIASGVIGEPGEWWDDLSEEYGLPGREDLAELRQKGEAVVADVKEGVSEAVDSLKEFDEKSGLKALRERVFGYLDVDDRFQGWMQDSVMAPLLVLKDPKKVIEFLGLDTPEKRAEFYKNSLGNALSAAAVGSGSYLFYRLIDSPWKGTMTGVNVALYMVMQNEGVKEGAIEVFESLQSTVESLRVETKKILTHLGIQPEWVGLQDNGFGLKKIMDLLFETAKEHPDFAVLGALNAAYLSRKVIRAVVLMSLEFLVTAPASAWGFIMENKLVSGIIAGVGMVTFLDRRNVLSDLAEVLYPDSPEARRAFMDDMHRYLEAIPMASVTESPTPLEVAAHPVYESMIKDPIEFFSDPDRRFNVFEPIMKGDLKMFCDAAGNWLIGYGVGINPVYHTVRLSQETVESIFDEWEVRGIRPDNVGLYVTYAGELLVAGAAAVGAGRGFVALHNDFHGSTGQIPRVMRGLLRVNGPQWRFLFRSMARQNADVFTLGQFTQLIHGYELNQFSFAVDSFLIEAEGISSRGATSQVSVDALIKYRDNARGMVSWLEAKGVTQDYVVSQDIKLQREFRGILEKLNGLISKSESVQNFNKVEFDALLKETRGLVERTQTRWTRAFIVYQRVRDLIPFGGRRSSLFDRISVSNGSEISFKQIDALSSTPLRTHAPELSRLGFSRESILGLDKSIGLTEADVLDLIARAKADPKLAPSSNELVYNTRYAKQMRVVTQFKRYGVGLPMAIMLAHGFATAPNKADFLTQFGIGATGFTAGVAAVRGAEMTFSGKMPPVARIVVDLAVGTAFAFGAGKVLDDYVISKLDYVFPNRNSVDLKLYPLFFLSGGHTIDHLLTKFNGVDEETDPLEYLSSTITGFAGTQDVRFRFDEDLSKKAEERIAKYNEEIKGWKAEHAMLDPSTQKALQLEKDILKKEVAIERLKTYVDGSWVDAARVELAILSAMIDPLKEKFMEGLGDQGRTLVSTVVTRVGTGQPLVDDGDLPIWQRLLDAKPIKLEDGDRAYSFRDFVALVTYVKRREGQFERLGFKPIRFSAEPEAPPEDTTPRS